MNVNTYFGVRSLETVTKTISSLDTSAQCALFLGIGIAVYGYFKYGKGNKQVAKKSNIKVN